MRRNILLTLRATDLSIVNRNDIDNYLWYKTSAASGDLGSLFFFLNLKREMFLNSCRSLGQHVLIKSI